MALFPVCVVFAAGDETVGDVFGAGRDAHVAHVVRRRTTIAAEHASCKQGSIVSVCERRRC